MKTGILCFVLSAFALGGWIFHQFVAGPSGILEDTSYFALPAAFWSTVLFTLFVGLAIEGMVRVGRARR